MSLNISQVALHVSFAIGAGPRIPQVEHAAWVPGAVNRYTVPGPGRRWRIFEPAQKVDAAAGAGGALPQAQIPNFTGAV